MEVLFVNSVGLVSSWIALSRLLGLPPVDWTLGDLTWLVDVLAPVRELRLDLLERSVLIASGALISPPPLETSLVWRRGEALLIEGFRGMG